MAWRQAQDEDFQHPVLFHLCLLSHFRFTTHRVFASGLHPKNQRIHTKQPNQGVGFVNLKSVFQLAELKRLRIAIALILSVIFGGTVVYVLLEDYSISEAFYMTVITVGTVGFMEVHPLSELGRWFTALLILFSLGTFAYSLSAITSIIVEGQFQQYISGYKVNTEIEKLKNHVIVCGFGRNGSQAVVKLLEFDAKVVVIEKDEQICKALFEGKKHLVVHGDATDDATLVKANIQNARALISTLDHDTNNVFVVLSARNLNPELNIISRASSEVNDSKLRIAGANHVIMPDKIGGAHMAAMIARYELLEFIDFLSSQSDDQGGKLEEILVSDFKSEFLGQSLSDLKIIENTGVNIIGTRSKQGQIEVNPSLQKILGEQLQLFALGTTSQFNTLKNIYLDNA